jgi:hypothetical protein
MVVSLVADFLTFTSMATVLINTFFQNTPPYGLFGSYIYYSRKVPIELYILFTLFALSVNNSRTRFIGLGAVSLLAGVYGNIGWPLWLSGLIIVIFGSLEPDTNVEPKTDTNVEQKFNLFHSIFKYTSVLVTILMLVSVFYLKSSSMIKGKGDDSVNKLLLG